MPSLALMLADTQAYVLANNALHACASRCRFDAITVFSDRPDLWGRMGHVQVPRMATIEDYNQIVLQQFPAALQQDFCIVAQYDGFILHADSFDPGFFAFDYIGAVWPDYPFHRVGNGGFSWRSARLMRAVSELSHLRRAGEAEDLFICRTLRPLLESRYGCVFADEDSARRFSYEIVPDGRPAFGFHGVFNLPLVYRDSLEYLVSHLPDSVLQSKLGYLRYGAQLLGPQTLARFDQLVAEKGPFAAG